MPCPHYSEYAKEFHEPGSGGPLNLPFQRPAEACRTFTSNAINSAINAITSRFADLDLARLFTNAFPNSLDTTIESVACIDELQNNTCIPLSYVITGDIDIMWLRDSTNQLMPYKDYLTQDVSLKRLFLGLIYLQSHFISDVDPYANAYRISRNSLENMSVTLVTSPSLSASYPKGGISTEVGSYNWEVDSLASFLSASYHYWDATGDDSFADSPLWLRAVQTVLDTVTDQQAPTYDSQTGAILPTNYTQHTHCSTHATDMQILQGHGSPVRRTGMVKSPFRPSDDASVFPFFVPGNAQLSVELGHVATILEKKNHTEIAARANALSTEIRDAIYKYAVKDHPEFGKVFAYEVDGYGGAIFMDDANVPSLLSLSYLGFVDQNDLIYQNTRKLVLSPEGNPYFFFGPRGSGIGSPHIGLGYVWPISTIMQMMTSSNDSEIKEALDSLVKSTDNTGLIHESYRIYEGPGDSYTRSWFGWANSLFAQAILKLAKEKPHLIFK